MTMSARAVPERGGSVQCLGAAVPKAGNTISPLNVVETHYETC